MSTRRKFLKTASLGGLLGVSIPTIVEAAIPGNDPESGKGGKKVRLSEGDVVLFQGDSITDARRKKDDKEPNSSPALGVSYPFFAAGELLYRAPEKDFKVYNRGISGNKVYQLADRWDTDCLDLKPTVLSILVGVNDFWHTLVNGYKGTVQTYRDDYKKLLDRTKTALPSVKLIIGEPYAVKGVKAVDDKWFPAFDEYRQVSREIAREYDAAFIPYQEVYDKAPGPGSYWTADGVHPTLAGAKLMAEAWMKVVSFLLVLLFGVGMVKAQDGVHYSGTTISNVDYHHGELAPVIGVHNIQVFRANREHPELAEDSGWTYNHAPMLAYWNRKFYLEYLSDKVGESIPPGQTLLLTSDDGYVWTKPKVIFPPYRVPDGTTKEGHTGVAKDLFAVMHQRMGFYVSKRGRLLALGFYGICLDPHDDPNDGLGIGRVVREIKADGSWGPIYFIHYNPAWSTSNTSYPYYTSSGDKGFVADCNELMATPLMMMQWVEETDRRDPLIPLHKDYKAFNFYHLPDGRAVGLWKNALTSISKDEGKTWSSVGRAPHFVNANAKIWGQKTSDGRYAVVYNPSEFRWPLAISTSKDGLDYTDLLLVEGEISTARYGGAYKNYGPQYTRGIIEGNGVAPDGNMWITFSMNKEDIWVGTIPVPVTSVADKDADDVFDRLPAGKELQNWNVYSPLWAPVRIGKDAHGARCLVLKDEDPYDLAKAERVFPAARQMQVEFAVEPAQADHGQLQIEVQSEQNLPAMRLSFEPDGNLIAKAGARIKNVLKYSAGQTYVVRLSLNMDTRMYTVNVNGKDMFTQVFFSPVPAFGHIVFRTGEARRYPGADSPAEAWEDVPHAGDKVAAAEFFISYLKTGR